MLRPQVIAFAFVVGLLATLTASGQPNPVQPTRLALEVHLYPNEPPAYVVVIPSAVPAKGNIFFRFPRVPGWTTPAGSPLVESVRVCPVLAGDLVRVSVSVFLGRGYDQEKDVAVYTLREGEKLRLKELTQFGVEPFEIALIRVAPANAGLPQVTSKGKSIELVTVQANLSTFPTYRVALRNLSNKNVSALSFQVLAEGRTALSGMRHGEEGNALIPAGGVSEITVLTKTQASATPGGYQPVTPANQIIEISTVVFEDGSFEGDIEAAAMFRAVVKGRKIQLRRVVDAFQSILQNASSDPSSALELLRNKVSALGIEADSVAVQEVVGEFSALGERPKRDLTSVIEGTMSEIRRDVQEDVAKFRLGNPNLDATAFRTWLVASKQRYEAWLARI